MSNASLKEQLEAVATQLTKKTSQNPSSNNEPQKPIAKSPPSLVTPKPKQINQNAKKTKPKWLDYVQYGVELLRVYFPESFKLPSEVKPLKKGIKEDLLKQLSMMDKIVTDDKACMVKSLTYYVNTTAYHRSVQEGAERIGLDGNPSGTVSPEEALYSSEKYQAKLLKQKSSLKTSIQEKDMVN